MNNQRTKAMKLLIFSLLMACTNITRDVDCNSTYNTMKAEGERVRKCAMRFETEEPFHILQCINTLDAYAAFLKKGPLSHLRSKKIDWHMMNSDLINVSFDPMPKEAWTLTSMVYRVRLCYGFIVSENWVRVDAAIHVCDLLTDELIHIIQYETIPQMLDAYKRIDTTEFYVSKAVLTTRRTMQTMVHFFNSIMDHLAVILLYSSLRWVFAIATRD